MTANKEGVNNLAGAQQQPLIKLLETVHTECLHVELAKEQVPSIHRTAEKDEVVGNWASAKSHSWKLQGKARVVGTKFDNFVGWSHCHYRSNS